MRKRHKSMAFPLSLRALAFLGLFFSPGLLSGQTFLGSIMDVSGEGRVRVRLDTEVREGILAYVVFFDEEYDTWIAKAEISLDQIAEGVAVSSLVYTDGEFPMEVGDRVAIYEPPPDPQVSLRVRPSVLRLIAGEQADLSAELVDEEGFTLQSVVATWRSSDEDVATVNQFGRVVGMRAGRTTLSATSSVGLVSAITVDVLDPSFTTRDSVSLFIGAPPDTVRMVLASAPGVPVSPFSFSWETDDPAIASVSAEGVIEPLRAGATRLNIEGYNQTLVVPVRVYERSSDVAFEPFGETIDIVRGEAFDLSASVMLVGGNHLDQMEPRILEIDSLYLAGGEGEPVVALMEGESILRVSAAGRTKEWVVRVHPPGVSIDLPVKILPLGGSFELSAVSTRLDGAELGRALGVRWASSDPDVLSVENGRAVARTVGRARISATYGPRTDEVDVFVLGELLATVKTGFRTEIRTISLGSREILPLPGSPLEGWSPSFSPDGSQIVFISKEEGFLPRLYVADAVGENPRRIAEDFEGLLGTRNPLYQVHDPVWAFDGQRIVFSSNHQGSYDIYSIRPDGTDLRRLSRSGSLERRPSVTPDGPRIAYERWSGQKSPSVVISSMDGSDRIDLKGRGTSIGLEKRQSRPVLLSGGTRALMIGDKATVSLDGDGGSSLLLVDLSTVTSPSVRRILFDSPEDQELIYALSPDEKYVAYTQRKPLSDGGETITVIDMDGQLMASLTVPPGEVVRDLTWATDPQFPAGGEEK